MYHKIIADNFNTRLFYITGYFVYLLKVVKKQSRRSALNINF